MTIIEKKIEIYFGIYYEDILLIKNFYFYDNMRNAGKYLNKEAKKSADKYLNNIQPYGIVSMDGSWNYKYNSMFCIDAFNIINKYKINIQIILVHLIKWKYMDFLKLCQK